MKTAKEAREETEKVKIEVGRAFLLLTEDKIEKAVSTGQSSCSMQYKGFELGADKTIAMLKDLGYKCEIDPKKETLIITWR